MGFIALLTPFKIKFLYTEFYQYGCVFKKSAWRAFKTLLKECERLEGLQRA